LLYMLLSMLLSLSPSHSFAALSSIPLLRAVACAACFVLECVLNMYSNVYSLCTRMRTRYVLECVLECVLNMYSNVYSLCTRMCTRMCTRTCTRYAMQCCCAHILGPPRRLRRVPQRGNDNNTGSQNDSQYPAVAAAVPLAAVPTTSTPLTAASGSTEPEAANMSSSSMQVAGAADAGNTATTPRTTSTVTRTRVSFDHAAAYVSQPQPVATTVTITTTTYTTTETNVSATLLVNISAGEGGWSVSSSSSSNTTAFDEHGRLPQRPRPRGAWLHLNYCRYEPVYRCCQSPSLTFLAVRCARAVGEPAA